MCRQLRSDEQTCRQQAREAPWWIFPQPSEWTVKSSSRWIPKNLLGRKILLEFVWYHPKGWDVSVRAFFVCFFSGPHSWAAWSWGVTPKTKVGGFGTHHQAGESWAFESYGQSCDQGTERILFFWIESVTRGRVQGMGIIFEAWAAQMVSWRWIKIWWTKFSAPKSCWLKKWIPGGRWNIFDPTWSTRVPRPWGGPVWIFFVLLKLGNVDTMLEAVVFVVCWQFFG